MESRDWKNIRTPAFRYLLYDDDRELLWDLEKDPSESRNVAGDPKYQKILADHRKLMLSRLLKAERPLARTWPY
ncbi:hypothetical protein [Puniceicoccus vermicola]|uniref:DUF4976 domain-containing protein n=1 Tax=Puniceicoccus vermicola TaxID=388746 RepID=A0A7X1E594_9BACT|nr:hypothetical protein [Puniceicoccus vermicola]MBC2602931.1 hypothetical protein [Puniceicoccus vermicola]